MGKKINPKLRKRNIEIRRDYLNNNYYKKELYNYAKDKITLKRNMKKAEIIDLIISYEKW